MLLYWKEEENCASLTTHTLSLPLSKVLLPWLRTQITFQQHYSGKKTELTTISQWLCSQIFHWTYHEETWGPCGFTSNRGSVPPSTAGSVSSGNTAMAAPSMGRVKVSHSHGKSHVQTSKILKSPSTNSLQIWNWCGRSERALRIFPSWLKVTALLPMVPRQLWASCQWNSVTR